MAPFKFNKDNSLIRDNAILFFCTLILNFTGFVYHFLMGRILGPSSYGVLGAVLSLFILLAVPLNVIQTAVTKFVAEYRGKKEENKINYFFVKSLQKLFSWGIVFFLLFLILTPFIASFLNIETSNLLFLSPVVIFTLLLPVSRGLLQGLQQFKELGYSLISEGILKVGLGYLLVYLGMHINGAILAMVLSFVGSFFISCFILRKRFHFTITSLDKKRILHYSLPVFIALASLNIFFTADVLLVKHFFDEVTAGYYTALSLLGKIIFFATFSIGNVMFPKVAEMHAVKQQHIFVFIKSLALIFIGGLCAVIVYYLLPKFIVSILYGKGYLAITSLVAPMGIFFLLVSLAYITVLYNLSVENLHVNYVLLLFNILQVVLLFFFHQSLQEVIAVLICLMAVLLLILLVMTRFNHEKRTINYHTSI